MSRLVRAFVSDVELSCSAWRGDESRRPIAVASWGPSSIGERATLIGHTSGWKKIFLNASGLRAGWRLLVFIGIFLGLGLLTDSILPRLFHFRQRSFLDPVALISNEVQNCL